MASSRKYSLLTDVQRSVLSRYFDEGMTGKGQANNTLIEKASEAKVSKETIKHDLDIETLESKGHWATMDELLQVIPYHLPRYEKIIKQCKNHPNDPLCALELSFATRFIAVYLFLQVKCSRPMTFQYLTVQMIETAKINGGFVDQKQFKTASTYGFDSLMFNTADIQVIDDFIRHVRPRLEPKCDYVLVTRNGRQYNKLSNLMTKMVFDAIGKYIHPSRYRQIVETESVKNLTKEEQDVVSKNQKHSSVVARVHYQKQHSRDIAKKGQECMKKLQGIKGEQVEEYIQSKLCALNQAPTLSNKDQAASVSNEELTTNEIQNTHYQDKTKVPEKRSQQEVENSDKLVVKRLQFTKEEDEFLKEGLLHYGYGQWTPILRDKRFKFPKGRKPDSLKKRADSKFPTLCKKK
ncbi:uncharacterized protein LOC110239457 [Exaiptasia diaphana]|uniref:Uncharacterized protein n=1 Tax=Exaiptasia diaphana TaxID=2652724 RepID=A0A913YKF2_EXADI|nr:uncharacterized protein LOC110239457 [Exaiptasia diaphana]